MSNVEDQQPVDWQESRWFRAWELHQQGWSQARIAEELGVAPQSYSNHRLKMTTTSETEVYKANYGIGQCVIY